MTFTDPTIDEWRRLYEAAADLKAQAPWLWMWEDQIFGVRDPETGQIGYVSIMGANGEHLALAAYLGSEGLDGYQCLVRGEVKDPAFLLEVPQLQVSFEDRDLLRKQDRDVIKALGLKFRGRMAWPLFRSYQPGRAPWFLRPAEARFLTVVVEQALDVTQRLADIPNLLEPPHGPDQYLVRVQTEQGWADQWLSPEPVPVRPPPAVDTKRLETMRKQLPRQDYVLQVDLFALPTFVTDEGDERPYLPYDLLIVEARSRFVVGAELLIARPSIETVWEQTMTRFLSKLEEIGGLPSQIAVRSERLHNLLMPIAAGLGIRLQMARRLPALDEARTSLLRWLR